MKKTQAKLRESTKKLVKGRTALVTGASSGLGVEFAKLLAESGANLILAARNEEKLKEIKAEIENEYKVDVEIFPIDLSKGKSAQQLHTFAKDKNVSLLINNAGVGLFGSFLKSSLSKTSDMINLNINSLVKLSHLFATDMVKNSDGFILQIASVAGFMPLQNYAVYAATKSFVLSFSQSLNWELEGTGVSSTALCPGATKTAFFSVAGHNANRLITSTMMESRTVAVIGIESMMRREDKIVAGIANKISVGATSVLPSKLSKRLTAEFMK